MGVRGLFLALGHAPECDHRHSKAVLVEFLSVVVKVRVYHALFCSTLLSLCTVNYLCISL